MKERWWTLILAVTNDLTEAKIAYSIDAASALFAHGIDVPDMVDLDISVQWEDLTRAHALFAPADPTPITYHPGWALFRFTRDGLPVDLLSYKGTVLAEDPDRVALQHAGRTIWSKSVAFYERHLPAGDRRRAWINQWRSGAGPS